MCRITSQILKSYLIEGKNPFLLNKDNNGKTIMLSGTWGSGKTYFWQEEIELSLTKKLTSINKSYVYISMYGKNNIRELRQEILFKSSENITKEKTSFSNAISAFGIDALSTISFDDIDTPLAVEAVKTLFNNRKIQNGIDNISNGGIICLDDFERKSKSIDLNDLFGFISILVLEMQCKVVIIVNSENFIGIEKDIFKRVKEKTINKFIEFRPTIEELFYSIIKNKRYTTLDSYKDDIFQIIKSTEELNARIYTQVLDNCLEWHSIYTLNKDTLKTLVLSTINFIQNHFTFDIKLVDNNIRYSIIDTFIEYKEISLYIKKYFPEQQASIHKSKVIADMHNELNTQKGLSQTDDYYQRLNIFFENNKKILESFYFYVYKLDIKGHTDNEKFKAINNFVKTGILYKE